MQSIKYNTSILTPSQYWFCYYYVTYDNKLIIPYKSHATAGLKDTYKFIYRCSFRKLSRNTNVNTGDPGMFLGFAVYLIVQEALVDK